MDRLTTEVIDAILNHYPTVEASAIEQAVAVALRGKDTILSEQDGVEPSAPRSFTLHTCSAKLMVRMPEYGVKPRP